MDPRFMTSPLVSSTQGAEMAQYVDTLEYPFCQDVSKYEKIVKVSGVSAVNETRVYHIWLFYYYDYLIYIYIYIY